MKITNRQTILLLTILRDTVSFTNFNFGGLDKKDRKRLYDTIINQQSTKLIELKK